MKIKRTDAHDRFLHLSSQQFDIGKTCQEMVDKEPFGNRPFYIFAHKREIGLDEKKDLLASGQFTIENIPSHRILWQARLLKPYPQENSMLFKAYPRTDNVRVIWMIPDRHLWGQYAKDKMTANETVCNSIHDFTHHPAKMGAPEEGDPTDEEARAIYKQILKNKRKNHG